MSGRIISEGNRIRIYPPHSPAAYLIELKKDTDHIQVWLENDGHLFPIDDIPFSLIPYMGLLIKRRTAERTKTLCHHHDCDNLKFPTLSR